MLQNPFLLTCFWGEKKIFHLPSPWTTGRPEPDKYPENALCLSGCAPAALCHLNRAPKAQKFPRLAKKAAKLLLKKPLQYKLPVLGSKCLQERVWIAELTQVEGPLEVASSSPLLRAGCRATFVWVLTVCKGGDYAAGPGTWRENHATLSPDLGQALVCGCACLSSVSQQWFLCLNKSKSKYAA